MDEAWTALLGALIGALAGVSAAWLAASRHEKTEHTKWLREQRRQAYSNALRCLARSTVVPIGTDIDAIKTWFRGLAEVREWLVVLHVYCARGQDRIVEVSEELFAAIEENSFVFVATQVAALREESGDSCCFVAWGVAQIRARINEVLAEITQSARLDLVRDIKP